MKDWRHDCIQHTCLGPMWAQQARIQTKRQNKAKRSCSHLSGTNIMCKRCGWKVSRWKASHHPPKTDCCALNLQQGGESRVGRVGWENPKPQNLQLCPQPAQLEELSSSIQILDQTQTPRTKTLELNHKTCKGEI